MNIEAIGESRIDYWEGEPNPPVPQIYLPMVFSAEYEAPKLVVISFNTYDDSGADFGPDLESFVNSVSGNDGAIVGLQEATPDEVRQLIAQRGWRCAVSGNEQHLCDTNPGYAFELDMSTIQYHEMTACRGVPRVAVSANIVGPGGETITVVTTHICHVQSDKPVAFQRLFDTVTKLGGKAVVAADFNSLPDELQNYVQIREVACTATDPECASVGERGPVDNIAVVFTDPNTGHTMRITHGQRGPVGDVSDHTTVSGEVSQIASTREMVGTPDSNYPPMSQPIGYPVGN